MRNPGSMPFLLIHPPLKILTIQQTPLRCPHNASPLVDSVDGVYPDPLYLANDPNAAIPEHGLFIVLFCNVTTYDVKYSRVNGTVVYLEAAPSNGTLGGMVLGPLRYKYELAKWTESLRI